jgi:tetratricopeptide (TPR) repeat protein
MPQYQHDLAVTHNNLGNLLADLGQRDAAREEYETARDLQKKLAAAFPAVPEYQHKLSRTHNNLGNLLANLGQRDAARTEYEAARDLYKKLSEDFPAVRQYQVELGLTYGNFGHLFRSERKWADSLPWYDLAIRTLTPVNKQEPRDVMAKHFLRNTHLGRADAHHQLQQYVDAVEDWDRAIELSPPADQPQLRASRATSRVQAGQVAEAVADVAELTKSPQLSLGDWYNFACV